MGGGDVGGWGDRGWGEGRGIGEIVRRSRWGKRKGKGAEWVLENVH